jgi:hypothetical protein
MRPLFTLFLCSFLINCLNAQTKDIDTLHINQIYKDVSEYLISEKIIEIDSTSQSILLERFGNWGGKTFIDYEKVKTSKTESQVVLMYIFLDQYFQLIAQFKDNKAKISIYDAGNVAKSYINGPAYSLKLIRMFQNKRDFIKGQNEYNGMLIYETKMTPKNFKAMTVRDLLYYKENSENTILSIEKFLKDSSGNSKKDDW